MPGNSDLLTYREALIRGRDALNTVSDTPYLDAVLLLCFAAGLTKDKLLAMNPDPVDAEIQKNYDCYITRRADGEFVAHITGTKEFFGLDFIVSRDTLIPRPDTEILVEDALNCINELESSNPSDTLSILDVCTGTGCVAIAIADNAPQDSQITGVDISPMALKIARQNGKRLAPRVTWLESDLFDALNPEKNKFHIIVSNPPYVTTDDTNEMFSRKWPEPRLALDGGNDGLDLIRIIIKKSLDYLENDGYLLIEASDDEAEAIARLFSEAGFLDVRHSCDLAGRRRVTRGRRP